MKFNEPRLEGFDSYEEWEDAVERHEIEVSYYFDNNREDRQCRD